MATVRWWFFSFKAALSIRSRSYGKAHLKTRRLELIDPAIAVKVSCAHASTPHPSTEYGIQIPRLITFRHLGNRQHLDRSSIARRSEFLETLTTELG